MIILNISDDQALCLYNILRYDFAGNGISTDQYKDVKRIVERCRVDDIPFTYKPMTRISLRKAQQERLLLQLSQIWQSQSFPVEVKKRTIVGSLLLRLYASPDLQETFNTEIL